MIGGPASPQLHVSMPSEPDVVRTIDRVAKMVADFGFDFEAHFIVCN